MIARGRDPYTAKTQYRKFETNIPRKEIAAPRSQFPHLCVCKRFINCHDRSAYSGVGKYVDQSWKYINRSQIHECGNWDWGRAIHFLGIHKLDFCCSAPNIGNLLDPPQFPLPSLFKCDQMSLIVIVYDIVNHMERKINYFISFIYLLPIRPLQTLFSFIPTPTFHTLGHRFEYYLTWDKYAKGEGKILQVILAWCCYA
jgi:hypothetical protein